MEEKIERDSSKNIRIGTILGYFSLALSIVSGLLYTPWIKNTIGKDSYGLYTLTTSLVNLFLIDFGLSATINTFLAKYRAVKDENGISNFLALAYKLFFFIDAFLVLIFTVIYFFIDKIYVGLTPEQLANFKNIYLVAALFSVFSFPCTIFSGVIQSYEKFVALKIIDIIHRVIFVCTSALALIFGWGLIGLVLANFGSAFLCHLFRYIYIRFAIKAKACLSYKPSKAFIKSVFFYSGWAAIQAIASRLVFNVMPSILGIVSDANNIATFGFISQLEGYVYMFGNVMGGFFLPKIARLKEEGDSRDQLEKMAIKVGKIQFFFVGLLFAGFVSCGIDFIALWLRDSATMEVYIGVIIIIAYQLIFVPEAIYYNEMFLANKVKYLAIGSLIKAALNCGLAFLFGKYYGALGAAISVAISRVFELLFINVAFKKCLKASLGTFFKSVYLRTTPTMILSTLIGLLFAMFLPISAAIRLFISGTSSVIIFVVFYMLFGFTKEEKKQFLNAIKTKRGKSPNS